MSPESKSQELGERIREGYVAAGFNRSQFSRALNVNYTTVIHWEKGTKTPSGESIQAIAQVLGKTADWVLSGEAAPAAPTPSHSPRPGYQKRADSAWESFLESDRAIVSQFTPAELEEIRGIRFRAGAPSSAAFYRHIALAKLDHRAGGDIIEALGAKDVTPAYKAGDSLKLEKAPKTARRRVTKR